MDTHILINKLHKLHRLSNDAKLMFAQAADQTTDKMLNELFMEVCDKRKRNAKELYSYIERLGGYPPLTSSSVSGNFQRLWSEIKSAFARNDDRVAVEGCLSRETQAISAYLELLSNEPLHPEIREMLSDHLSGMYEVADYLRSWLSEFDDRDEEEISQLNKLLTVNYDAQMVFRQAAETAENKEMKAVFMDITRVHRSIIEELRVAIRNGNGQPKLGTSITSDYQQLLMSVKRLLSSKEKNDEVLLKECVNCEDTALRAYQEALGENDFSEATQKLVAKQHKDLTDIYADMKSLSHDMAEA